MPKPSSPTIKPITNYTLIDTLPNYLFIPWDANNKLLYTSNHFSYYDNVFATILTYNVLAYNYVAVDTQLNDHSAQCITFDSTFAQNPYVDTIQHDLADYLDDHGLVNDDYGVRQWATDVLEDDNHLGFKYLSEVRDYRAFILQNPSAVHDLTNVADDFEKFLHNKGQLSSYLYDYTYNITRALLSPSYNCNTAIMSSQEEGSSNVQWIIDKYIEHAKKQK